MDRKIQIAWQYIDYLEEIGIKTDYVVPAKGAKGDKYSIKLWRVAGYKNLLSIEQLYRLATSRCPACTRRFVARHGRGRKRKYCSLRCKNRAYQKRKVIK